MHPLDTAIALTPTTAGHFLAHTSPDYANMIGPFGGATCAVMLNAALQHPDKIGVPAVSYTHLTLPTNREV